MAGSNTYQLLIPDADIVNLSPVFFTILKDSITISSYCMVIVIARAFETTIQKGEIL
ncbi:guanylate kinase [Sporosarcina newyorkensis 2681]|uniref:Guanylate kinase n=1 Tax=Sporosarcina newyorkensis 2681 TaxID=1027292 RepID=F9DTN1_9BACL|nr:guanylate kinase [Sporosarcina newyorkensis 2681]